MSEGLFERKLGLLMENLEKRSMERHMRHNNDIDKTNLVPTSQLEASHEPTHSPIMGFDDEIISVDTFWYEDAIKQPKKKVSACRGTP